MGAKCLHRSSTRDKSFLKRDDTPFSVSLTRNPSCGDNEIPEKQQLTRSDSPIHFTLNADHLSLFRHEESLALTSGVISLFVELGNEQNTHLMRQLRACQLLQREKGQVTFIE